MIRHSAPLYYLGGILILKNFDLNQARFQDVAKIN